MLKSMLFKTFVLSFCCALPLTAVYGMEEELGNGYGITASRESIDKEQTLELPAEMWSNIFGRLPLNDQIRTVPLVCQFFKSVSEDTLKSAADPLQRQLATRAGNISISELKHILKRDENSLPYLTLISGCNEGIGLRVSFEFGNQPLRTAAGLSSSWRKKDFPEFTLHPDSRVVLRQNRFAPGVEKKHYLIKFERSGGGLIYPIQDSPSSMTTGPRIGDTVIISPGTDGDNKYVYKIEGIKDPQKDL